VRKFINWLSSWATTIHIMLFERETYRILRDWTDSDPYEFVEVERPGN